MRARPRNVMVWGMILAVALVAGCSAGQHAAPLPTTPGIPIGLPNRTTNNDRAACSRLATALREGVELRQKPGSITRATVIASFRATLAAGERADDPKLRASVIAFARFALGSGTTAQEPDPFYPDIRCERIARPLPLDVGVVPLSAG